jgi:hypothetical protein
MGRHRAWYILPHVGGTGCRLSLAHFGRLLTGALAWIEHDPERPGRTGEEPFARVLFRWDGTRYDTPDWRPVSRAQVAALLGEPLRDAWTREA